MNNTATVLPVIEIQAREEKGTRANNRLRKEGLIPSIVYHRGEESLKGVVTSKDFMRVASQSKSSQVFSIKSSDSRFNGKTCLVKEIQRDFLKGRVLHVDFQSLKDDEEISVRVPIRIVGEAYGVKNDGGILTVSVHDLGVSCLPRLIPSEILVDVADLHLGKGIHASDIVLPPGVNLEDDAHETIVSVVAVRVVEETPATPTAEEAAAGAAAAAPAAGAAAAAPEKKDKK